MSLFICPICGNILEKNDKTYFCKNHHCFDIAGANYVNLLMSQASKNKRHGDDKAMVRARRDFLGKGYYAVLLEALLSAMEKYMSSGCIIADLGCGEGWYTDNIYRFAKEKNYDIRMLGIDISKTAVSFLAKRNKNIETAVASTSSVPIKSGSCDICLSVFAPYEIQEIKRILKKGGCFVRVYPLDEHLLSLKKIIYDNVYLNRVRYDIPDGFELAVRKEVRDVLRLNDKTDIMNLFMMTPYYYKTSRADQEKISGLDMLETEIVFGIDVYKKQ